MAYGHKTYEPVQIISFLIKVLYSLNETSHTRASANASTRSESLCTPVESASARSRITRVETFGLRAEALGPHVETYVCDSFVE